MTKQNKYYSMRASGISLSLLMMLLFNVMAYATTGSPIAGCSLTGNNPVSTYTAYTYSLNGSLCSSAASWTVSCGSIIVDSETSTSVKIYFNNSSCSSAVIKALNSSGGTIASISITINTAQPLAGGAITNTSQSINYNSTPAQINASSSSNGSCDGYSYQWWYSTNNSIFYAIPGATNQNYQSGTLTTTTYFKRTVACGYQSATTSNIATVLVYPQLVTGTISPSSQTVNYNTSPSALSISGSTGGTGVYTYQWQVGSASNGSYTTIDGATGTSYSPGALTSETYYTVITSSNGASVISQPASVSTYPKLSGGTITPSAPSINYNTSPGQLTLSNVSGGNGTYAYQWESSLDASFVNKTIVASGSLTYTPPNLTSTTYYRVAVQSNGITTYSTLSKIRVYPTLQPGSITPANQAIAYGEDPIQMMDDEMTGGNYLYTFQWYSSSDGNSWSAIPGAIMGSYTPENLTSTTYYKLEVSSNGLSVMTSSAVIYVFPLIVGGEVSPAAQPPINYGADAIQLNILKVSGGSGSYSYQWQSSTNITDWSNIPAATGSTYSPVGLTQTTYYRVVVTGGLIGYSTIAVVEVYPQNVEFSTVTEASGLNYIRTRIINKEGIINKENAEQLTDVYDVAQTTQYVDGLGRPIQTVSKQGSPAQKDLVNLQVYDLYNREVKKYLPYVTTQSQDGNYKLNSLPWHSDFNDALYPDEHYYYSETIYETSPLNRVAKQGAPGIAWQPNSDESSDRSIKKVYEFNKADEVLLITYDTQTGNIVLNSLSYYNENQLYVNKTSDEHNHEMIEYIDKDGLTICKKVQYDTDVNSIKLYAETYYIYDDQNDLVVVLPPEAVKSIKSSLSN